MPSQLHDIKAAYNRLVRGHLQVNAEPPDQKDIANELGVSASAIHCNTSTLDIDGPPDWLILRLISFSNGILFILASVILRTGIVTSPFVAHSWRS